jgi:hypothetical protein
MLIQDCKKIFSQTIVYVKNIVIFVSLFNISVMPKYKNRKSFTGSPELKTSLPRGTINKLSEKYGVSYAYVWSVANGKTNTYNEALFQDILILAAIESKNRTKVNNILEPNN